MDRFRFPFCREVLILLLLWASPALSQTAIVFSVSGDQALDYPASIHYLPDEHTTIMPAAVAHAVNGPPGPDNFFVAMENKIGNVFHGDTFVL